MEVEEGYFRGAVAVSTKARRSFRCLKTDQVVNGGFLGRFLAAAEVPPLLLILDQVPVMEAPALLAGALAPNHQEELELETEVLVPAAALHRVIPPERAREQEVLVVVVVGRILLPTPVTTSLLALAALVQFSFIGNP